MAPPAKKRRGLQSLDTLAAEADVEAGGLVFEERPFAASQLAAPLTVASGSSPSRPLFCEECASAAGPLEAALALAAGRVSRAELLSLAAGVVGDEDRNGQLLRILAKSARTPALPTIPGESSGARGGSLVVGRPEVGAPESGELPSQLDVCFCSPACQQQWFGRSVCCGLGPLRALQEHASASGHRGVLLMAADVVARAAWPKGRPVSNDNVMMALEPLLRLGASEDCLTSRSAMRTFLASSAGMLPEAYALLLRTIPEDIRKEVEVSVPAALHRRVVLALKRWSLSLSGADIPSALEQYCAALCARDVPNIAQAEALMDLGPIVRAICDGRDSLDSCSEDDAACGEDRPFLGKDVPLMRTKKARATAPILLRRVLQDEDIALIKSMSADLAGTQHNKHSGAQWRTRYLHTAGEFRRRAPDLLQRIVDAAIRADAEPTGWGILSHGARAQCVRPRVIEHHLVSPGGALPDPTHFDGGSVITIDFMLSDPGVDFTGGEFCTAEGDGSYSQHSFARGDALLFVSHKPHCVRPVRTGMREVMIVELWEGAERTCSHRCPQHFGVCPLEAQAKQIAEGKTKAPRQRKGVGDRAIQMGLDLLAEDSARAFALTSFEGVAFFSRLAQLIAQSNMLRMASEAMERPLPEPNVQVVFEQAAPIARVRALSNLRSGEWLVVAPRSEWQEAASSDESRDETDADDAEDDDDDDDNDDESADKLGIDAGD